VVRFRRTAAALAALTVLAAPALAACSGSGGSSSSPTAPQLLAAAKKNLDAAQTLHFVLTSTGAPSSGTALTGGNGDVQRPSSFKGSLDVHVGGAPITVQVISAAGTVYAQLPFSSGYSKVDPASFGVGDPGKLLDPQTGISQLLTKAQNAKLGAEKRVGGTVVRQVSADLPGSLVQQLLTSKDPSKAVHAQLSIAEGSDQLRQVALTGPFFTATGTGTYTLALSGFGEHVSISAPPAG
jgi:lipoprotein LprG